MVLFWGKVWGIFLFKGHSMKHILIQGEQCVASLYSLGIMWGLVLFRVKHEAYFYSGVQCGTFFVQGDLLVMLLFS